jgi:hypothetical protein
MALTSESRATCSGESSQPAAPKLSSSCSTCRDDGRSDALLAQEPIQGNLGVGLAGLLGDLAHDAERPPVVLDVVPDPRLLELVWHFRDARFSGGSSPHRYLPERKPPPKGPHGMTPRRSSRQASNTSRSIFSSTSEYCGCRLTNLSNLPSSLTQSLYQLPAREVGDPDVAYLAGSYQIRERRQGLLQGRRRVSHVHLIEIM